MRHLIVTDSDIIESVGYESCGKADAVEVVFKSSPQHVYRYEATAQEFLRLITEESIGKAFHELFRKTKRPFTKSEMAPTLKK